MDERLRHELHSSDRAQLPAFVVVDSAASIINDLMMAGASQREAGKPMRAVAAGVGDISQLPTRARDEHNCRVYCCRMHDL